MPDKKINVTDSDLIEEEDEIPIEDLTDAADPDDFYAKRAFRVVYQNNNFLLPQISDLINTRQIINIRPEYQRRLRWTVSQKSRLIESLLLNIPVPSIFLFETEAARYEVMDGQQRLNAIREFFANEFRLASLSVLWPLNKLSYASMPPRIKRSLDRAVLSATILLLESDIEKVEGRRVISPDIRRFIFERLNTGGTRLNSQELRNAVYPSLFNEMIIRVTRDSLFTRIWGIPAYTESDPTEYYENPKRQRNRLFATMLDCQIVLRFFALRAEENIRGSMKGILDRCMEANLRADPVMIGNMEGEYLSRLKLADGLFDAHPFELPDGEKRTPRRSIAVYDAVLVALDQLWPKRLALEKKASTIQARLRAALTDPSTSKLLTGQGNTASSVKRRIEFVRELFSSSL